MRISKKLAAITRYLSTDYLEGGGPELGVNIQRPVEIHISLCISRERCFTSTARLADTEQKRVAEELRFVAALYMGFADTSLDAYAVKMKFGTLKVVQQRKPSHSTKYLFPQTISDAIASYHLKAFKDLVHSVGVGSLAVAAQPRVMEALEGKWIQWKQIRR